MNGSWLEKASYDAPGGEGLRPEAERLMDLIDCDDPSFPCVADVLAEMKRAGVELEERAIAIAIQLGRHRAETWVKPSARLPRQTKAESSRDSIVYYVRRGAVVKIGTTCDPRTRFNDLMPDEVLAVEPGDYVLEAQRHRQFRHLRTGSTEHFRITDGLLEHVRALREQHGDPNPDWPTQGNQERFLGSRQLLPALVAPHSSRLVTATEGADACGLNRSTVHMWVHRELLKSAGRNELGRRVYFLDHIEHLAASSTAAKRSA